VGEVLHIEQRDNRVFAVAEVDFDRIDPADLPDDAETAAWYWSPTLTFPRGTDRMRITGAAITEMALTTTPASLGLDPVRSTAQRPHRLSSLAMLCRAAATIDSRRWRSGVPLRVNRLDQQPIDTDRAGEKMIFGISRQVGRVLAVR
jgi:hypothetical protein